MPFFLNKSDELSLRHLPDLSESEASFSFQIPTIVQGDYLLAEDDPDFFQGASDSFIIPAAIQNADGQLTYSPPAHNLHSDKAGSSRQLEPLTRNWSRESGQSKSIMRSGFRQTTIFPSSNSSRSRPKVIAQGTHHDIVTPVVMPPISPYAEAAASDDFAMNLSRLAAQPHGLSTNVPNSLGSRESIQERGAFQDTEGIRAVLKLGSKTAADSMGKSCLKDPTSENITDASLPTGRGHQRQTVLTAQSILSAQEGLFNHDISTVSIEDPVAERLVIYSQRLTSTTPSTLIDRKKESKEVPSKDLPDAHDMSTHTDAPEAVSGAANRDDGPLTLSQLSPQKPCWKDKVTPPGVSLPSPMRLPTKRPTPGASNSNQMRKRSKIIIPKPQNEMLNSSDPHAPPKGRHKVLKSSLGSKTTSLRRKRVTSNPSRANKVPSTKADSNTLHTSRLQGNGFSRQANFTEKKNIPTDHVGRNPSTDKPIAKSESSKPSGFKFQSDERMELRKSGDDKKIGLVDRQRKHQRNLTIPDFKVFHAAREAEIAQRKENIQPVVPLPLELRTDRRVKERRNFDERIKEKERELAKAAEERQRERQEAEEREIREMRKRAIPKAHEVPEWYKDAPKKKAKLQSSVGA